MANIQWGSFFQWSFGPSSAWGSIETTTVGETHPTLVPSSSSNGEMSTAIQ